ncbi:MAG: DUF615 domain-containing protein [Nitrosomonas sp.]|uniref:ribosome biogenesis factor YjgA n=1 Tax=Nitrosomonas sp. TaxID=42353 RepID=UPI0032F02D54
MQKELEYNDNEETVPSKTRRKKDMRALQEIGEQLVELDPKKLAEFDLPEILVDAIKLARPMNKHGARRRQMQYIGCLMREIDALPIQEKLDSWQQTSKHQIARLHQLERWRERLLNDDNALTEFAQKYPQADLQCLRLLIRGAQKEKAAEKPPKNFRLLFQELQGIVEV